jgi:hypothetical protein
MQLLSKNVFRYVSKLHQLVASIKNERFAENYLHGALFGNGTEIKPKFIPWVLESPVAKLPSLAKIPNLTIYFRLRIHFAALGEVFFRLDNCFSQLLKQKVLF